MKRRSSGSKYLRRLLFVNPHDVTHDELVVREGEARHGYNVLRLRQGDTCDVFDGAGNIYHVEFAKKSSPKALYGHVQKKTRTEAESLRIDLLQALPQRGKFDDIIEQATELGVHTIVPVISERTMLRPKKAQQTKMGDRWHEVAIQAAKQAHTYILPRIETICTFQEALQYSSEACMFFICCCDCGKTLREILKERFSMPCKHIVICIGPEGGFSESEITAAEKNGAQRINLGQTVLKTTTAMVVAVGSIKNIF